MMAAADVLQRVRLHIHGAVQGVGFRPFVYRLAGRLDVAGWIRNDATGVIIEAEAVAPVLAEFVAAVRAEAPPRALIHNIAATALAPTGADGRAAVPDASGLVLSELERLGCPVSRRATPLDPDIWWELPQKIATPA